jgi:cell division protein ZapA
VATVEVSIAARRYAVACRNGEEEDLRTAASIVDEKARQVGSALGNLSEARQLLLASLLVADDLMDARNGTGTPMPLPQPDPGLAEALESMAERMEALANRLESGRSSS